MLKKLNKLINKKNYSVGNVVKCMITLNNRIISNNQHNTSLLPIC